MYNRQNWASKPDITKINVQIMSEIGGDVSFDVMGSSLVFRVATFVLSGAMIRATDRATRNHFQAVELSSNRVVPVFKYFDEIQATSTPMEVRKFFGEIEATRLHAQPKVREI
jgi:hypothetical protein